MDNIDLAEYQTLIQTEFKDINNKEWRVTIGKYVANKLTEPSVTEMAASLAGNPVNIQWEEKDIDDPIHGSRLTLNLLSNYDRKFIDFYTVSSNGLKCTLSYKDDLGNYIDYWQGVLDTEAYEEPFSRQEMYTVSLSFTDFAPLARAKYSYTGFLTVREFIYKAFRKYLYTNTTLSNVVDWSSTVIEGQSILDTQILSDNFYDEDGDGMSIYDVLSSILLPLGLHMIQKNGNFYIYDVNSLVDKSTTQLDLRRADAVLSTGVIYNNIKLNYDSNEDPIILSGEIEENAFVDEDKDKYEIHTTVGRGGYTNYIWFLNSSSQYINGTDDIDLFGSRTVTRNGTTYNLTPAVFDVNQDTSNGNIENSICVKAEKYSGGTWTAIAGSPVGILSTPIIYPIVSLKNGGFFSRVTDEEVPVDIGTSTSRSILTATRVKISVKVFASYLFDFLKNDDDTNKEDDATEFDGEVYEPAYMKVPARVRLKDADGNVIVHAMGTTWIDGDYADTDDDWTYMTAYDSKSKVIDNWADVTATLSIPPNNSGWLHIEIGNRIEIVTYSNGRNLYSDNDLMDKCHWVFVKDIAINAVDEFSKSQEVEDYSIEATVDEEASEVLSIDTMMGSAINLTHTAKGAYFKDGDYCTNFSRHGVAATVEYLYLRTLYAAYATRHAKVTTTAVLVKEPNPCTISTLSGKFVIVGETQDIALSRSELTLLESNKDSTDDIEISEIVGTSTLASTSTVTVRDGVNGSDAVAPESIYRVSKYSVYPAPESVDIDNYLPSGWYSTPQSVNPVSQFGFVSTRKKVNGIWGEFSTPAVISRWAADGTNGTDGVGVSETVITYAMSSSGTIAPSAGWQTDVPTLVAGNFLWTRTHWTYTDDSEKTGYSVSHIGTDGTNGNDGQSITSLTPQFIRTTSNTIIPTGTWLDTPPTWLDGTYIWTRNKIIYANPAATVYTIAIVDEARNRAAAAQAAADKAKQAIDAVEIGGRNLILDSENRIRFWSNSSSYPIHDESVDGVNYRRFKRIFTDGVTSTALSTYTNQMFTPLESGYYTLSIHFKPELYDISLRISLNTTYGEYKICKKSEWTRLKVIAYLEKDIEVRLFGVRGHMSEENEQWVNYNRYKLEKGNKATDWTPAPEDVEADAQAKADAAELAATQVANNAQAAADAAQAEAANKSKTFNSIPTTPYHIGDLFVDGSDLRRCVVERLTGSYNATDWGAATNYDNTTVVINEGVVTAGSIQVGGDSGFIKAGMTGDGTADDSVRFFAGDTFTNRNTAPFRVYQSGKTVQTDGVFSGRIDATSGSIGGFEIGDGHIGKTDGSQGLYFNSNRISLRKDRISTLISTGGHIVPAVILENHSVQSFTENTCMSISCKNSTKGNVALDVKAGQFRNFNMPIRVVTSNTTLTINDTYIVCNSTSNITITLPNLPIEQDGHVFYVKAYVNKYVIVEPATGCDILDANGGRGSDRLRGHGDCYMYVWCYELKCYMGGDMI